MNDTITVLPTDSSSSPTELVIRPTSASDTILAIPANIAAALATARDRCKTVEKNARNTFQKFNYASADGIIEAAKDALHETGLVVMPLPPQLHVSGSGQMAFYEMHRRIVLVHSSGEAIELPVSHWPVIPEKGRPLDKAFAIALTTSFGYFLRDLLCMPRVDATDDMTARNDPPDRYPATANGTTTVQPSPVPSDGPPVTAEQLIRIELLIGQLGLNLDAVSNRLKATYGTSSLDNLTIPQADDVERKLEAAFNTKQQTAA